MDCEARLPPPDATGIQVHEIRFRVVAHAAASEVQAGPAEIFCSHIGQPHIDGLAFQVLAAARNPAAVLAQHLIGGGRAVRRNDLGTARAADPILGGMQKVE